MILRKQPTDPLYPATSGLTSALSLCLAIWPLRSVYLLEESMLGSFFLVSMIQGVTRSPLSDNQPQNFRAGRCCRTPFVMEQDANKTESRNPI